jgi:glycosyltransferase involved in cell wall biosynthesis
MNILLKCPTRSRPQRVLATLSKYVQMALRPDKIGVAISCDTDDSSMSRNLVQEELHRILAPTAWHRIFFSPNTSKIEACNANMSEIDYPWDIVILVSDDMIPQVRGWDETIRTHMQSRFPDTDGLLWVNDGCQGNKLNTLCIYGRALYQQLGHIYEPAYKSLFCDTELTDRCTTGDLKDKTLYVPYCLIRHEHPGTGFPQLNDALYQTNQKYWSTDMSTYIHRKTYAYDWSVLIPTMTGREQTLARLLDSLHEKLRRLAPSLRVEVCLEYDAKEQSIGVKRQALLQRARGKYVSFIDDDDDITDAYIEDFQACLQGGHQVMRLRGQMGQYPFVHSTEITLKHPMATMDEPALFQRPPNHLNPMFADIAKLVSFKDATYGEDLEWTLRLYKTGLLTHEYRSPEPRVHYLYNIEGRTIHWSVIDTQRRQPYESVLTLLLTTPTPSPPGEPRPSVLRLGPRGFVSK